jgi:hypothetical protein
LDSTSSRKPFPCHSPESLCCLCPLMALFYNYLFICMYPHFPINYKFFGSRNVSYLTLYNQPLTEASTRCGIGRMKM